MMRRDQIIVVGAGISGVLLARGLRQAGCDVVILEKSRGFGGRMATRRWDEQRFDHGAQTFTLRSRLAQETFKPLIETGVLARWPNGTSTSPEEERWIGLPGMSSVARALAEGIHVINGARAETATPTETGWTVRLVDGAELSCSLLALTSPVPQSLDIIQPALDQVAPPIRQQLERIDYDPSYALLAKLDHPASGEWRAGREIEDERIAWIADNQSKLRPQETGNGALVAQSTPEFARRNEHTEREQVTEAMSSAVEQLIGARLSERRLHWWKYASPNTRIAEQALLSVTPSPTLFCGDAFGEGMIEGAVLSGIAACELALKHLQLPRR